METDSDILFIPPPPHYTQLYFEVLTLEDLERRSLSLEVSAERDELLVEKEVVARRIFALLKLKSIHEKSTK